MNFRAHTRLTSLTTCLLCLFYSSTAFSGYKAFMDPRSMAMGGTGVASATKFNASSHNPALIAFNRGSKPDKIYISASVGTREIHNSNLNQDVLDYQNSSLKQDFLVAVAEADATDSRVSGDKLNKFLKDKNMSSYRSDEYNAFSLLVDTDPVTINFFTRREIREMSVFLNNESSLITEIMNTLEDPNTELTISNVSDALTSSVESTYFEISEFGTTVATTNVYDYNMPFAWGFTPKLIQFQGSHILKLVDAYDINNPPQSNLGKAN